MTAGGAREGAGRPMGGKIRRLSTIVRARYGMSNDLPLDVMLASMEYWAAQCAKLVELEANLPPPTIDAATGNVVKSKEAIGLRDDLRYAFEQLTKIADKCAPYFHAKVQQVELGGQIDVRRLSYDDLQTLIPLLRKARTLTIEQRSESGEYEPPDGRGENNDGDGPQPGGGGGAPDDRSRPN
jgi:hypothetical protein